MLEWHRPRRAYYARKKNGFELKKEEAETYFDRINSKRGELNDDELDSVAGGKRCGTTYKMGNRLLTSSTAVISLELGRGSRLGDLW